MLGSLFGIEAINILGKHPEDARMVGIIKEEIVDSSLEENIGKEKPLDEEKLRLLHTLSHSYLRQ